MWLDVFNEMRKSSGMSLDELSEKSGVPKGTLAKITSGITKTPSLETMKSLVYAMGYTLDDLDKKENPPAPSEDEEGELTVDEVVSAFVSAGIVPEGKDLTDADLRFLLAIMDAIDRWFAN
ncbi:helix-turn-helix domain-containing protein [Flavonifractor plautii]|uniref:helix-turn-helix domain-containing protein n=1 Tax=Flavonifractor plautii TaxID=292800 RepID=UPI003516FC24